MLLGQGNPKTREFQIKLVFSCIAKSINFKFQKKKHLQCQNCEKCSVLQNDDYSFALLAHDVDELINFTQFQVNYLVKLTSKLEISFDMK